MATIAKTLAILRDDNLNVAWPRRPKGWDGWIGDEAHSHTSSDHNPNKRDRVDAEDVDATQPPAPRTPIHVPTVIASMIRHPSNNYVIHNRRIMSRKDKWMPRVYTGPNDHTKHIHDSILQTSLDENSTTRYKFILTGLKWAELKRGSTGESVKDLQAYLIGHGYGVAVDGDFGPKTDTSVRAFQKNHHLTVDGIVGPKTRAALRPF